MIHQLQLAIASTREVMAAVTPDQLDGDTPCASWNVADVINHIVGGQDFFQAGLEGRPPAGETDYASGDYLAAFDAAAAGTITAFSADGALEKVVSLPFGDMPGAALAGLATTDTFVHGWDLAKATGQSTDLNPALAEGLLTQSRMAIQDSFRGPEGAPFGPQQEAGPDASAADKLSAFLGRSI